MLGLVTGVVMGVTGVVVGVTYFFLENESKSFSITNYHEFQRNGTARVLHIIRPNII